MPLKVLNGPRLAKLPNADGLLHQVQESSTSYLPHRTLRNQEIYFKWWFYCISFWVWTQQRWVQHLHEKSRRARCYVKEWSALCLSVCVERHRLVKNKNCWSMSALYAKRTLECRATREVQSSRLQRRRSCGVPCSSSNELLDSQRPACVLLRQ